MLPRGKALHNLAQMVARQAKLCRQFGGEVGVIRRDCHAHQHPQPVISERGKTHAAGLFLNWYLQYSLTGLGRDANPICRRRAPRILRSVFQGMPQ